MAVWDKLFTGFKNVFSKDVAVEGKAVAKAVAKKDTAKILEKTAVAKPASVNTATKIYTETGSSVFKNTAKEIAGSKVVKTAGKVAAGTVIIGGATYGLGALAGKGMESVGYGWRDLTNAHTPQETTQEDLKNRSTAQELDQEQFDFLKKYYDWAQKNGISDSPSAREFYDQYISGSGSGSKDTTAKDTGKGIDPWLIGAGALAAAAGIYLIVKKKKGSKK